jgi:hypothetical protein
MSVSAIQHTIGIIVGALLNIGVMFLNFTSLGGAFFSGCPFRSAFSSAIRHIFEKAQTLFKRIERFLSLDWWVRILGCIYIALQLCVAVDIKLF